MKKQLSWKGAFFVLAGLILICILMVGIVLARYFPEVDDSHFEMKTGTEPAASLFEIRTGKQQLNQFIAKQIEKENHAFRYIVELTDEHVQFRTSLLVLGQEVPVTINFSPTVTAQGDLLLHMDTFSLGGIRVPEVRVLQLIKDFIELPKWVEIYPSDRLVHAKVTALTISQDITLRITSFDLVNDQISLDMTIN
ncbi:YpmS family protein [Halalkalibacter urbisdiaboli]|uniref:YpmS family protein n=1 Tax=Halalkalibacter urbisdiaboli TaxID=1960589 RepID=UPI0013FE4485|nr:YpmS family protein [Halalkalibacter urbisdiaboli]